MARIGEGEPDLGIPLLVVANVLMFVALVVIATRIICRVCILDTAGLDDWFAVLATILAIGMVVAISIGVAFGLGKMEYDRHVEEVDLAKLRLAVQILYTISSSLIKISILLLYLRIFPNLRIWIYVTIGFLVAMSITFIFAAVFQCNPVGKQWSPSETMKQLSCFPPLAFWCDVAAVFLATDIWIIVLPLRTVLKLQLSRKKKLIIMSLFGLGIFACGAAIARLVYVIKLYVGDDPSWEVVPVYICSIAEVSLALIACSVPPLRPAVNLLVDKVPCYKRKQISDIESPVVS